MAISNRNGRPSKHFVDPKRGKPIVGLSRRPSDGRWRIIGTQTTFTEPDEQKAIARFQKLTGELKYEGLPAATAEWLQTPAREIVDRNAVSEVSNGFGLVGKPDEAWQRFWKYVANEINSRPQWVAEQTGIEQIGYLNELSKPKPLPTFKQLESVWMEHSLTNTENKRKIVIDWRDFVKVTGIKSLEEITPEVAAKYRDAVHKRKSAGKTQSHFFGYVRRF